MKISRLDETLQNKNNKFKEIFWKVRRGSQEGVDQKKKKKNVENG